MINVNYPHPVLSGANNDYIDCIFDIDMPNKTNILGDLIEIKMTYSLTSVGLNHLIQDGKAMAVIYAECSETEFRELYAFDSYSNELIIQLNKQQLTKELELRGYIVANEALSEFTLPEHNKEFFVAGPSKIRKGDILAIADGFYQIPLENFDPLADRRSIFSIRLNPDQKEDLTIDYDSFQKITIMLNPELYEQYQNLYTAPETRTILATLFAVPVLVDALYRIKDSDESALEDLSSKKWYQVLQTRMTELKISIDTENNMTEVANKILTHVFRDTMNSFNSVFGELIGGNEL